jgi:hypothetical protein
MFRKVHHRCAAAALAALGVIAPGRLLPRATLFVHQLGGRGVRSRRPASVRALAAGTLYVTDAFSCQSYGAPTPCFIGSRGYDGGERRDQRHLDDISIVTHASTRRGVLAQRPGTTLTRTYNFAGAANSASHSCRCPSRTRLGLQLLRRGHNNTTLPAAVKFRWANAVSVVNKTTSRLPATATDSTGKTPGVLRGIRRPPPGTVTGGDGTAGTGARRAGFTSGSESCW